MELPVVVVTFIHVPKLLEIPPEVVVVMVILEVLEFWLETTVVIAGFLMESTKATVLHPFGVAVGWQREFMSSTTWQIMPGMSCCIWKAVGGCSTSIDDEVLFGVVLFRFLVGVDGCARFVEEACWDECDCFECRGGMMR